MKLKWQQAPVHTEWGDDIVVASVAIDNDHTVDFYCERDQIAKVEAMFAPQRKPLTDEEIRLIAYGDFGTDFREYLEDVLPLARAIEQAHGIKVET